MSKIAIIGGRGLEKPEFLTCVKQLKADTPFGEPAPVVFEGTYDGLEVIYLARHGGGESPSPFRINYRANLYALKQLDCAYILASSTCRSLQEEIRPGEMIILDQFIDMTTQRLSGIYDDHHPGESVYRPLGEPFSDELRDHLVEAAIVQGITVHTKGIVLSIEGPRFSSRAESKLYRNWGADVINMYTAPEVILANELGIPYATLALCTAYDSWRHDDGQSALDASLIAENKANMVKMLTYAMKKI